MRAPAPFDVVARSAVVLRGPGVAARAACRACEACLRRVDAKPPEVFGALEAQVDGGEVDAAAPAAAAVAPAAAAAAPAAAGSGKYGWAPLNSVDELDAWTANATNMKTFEAFVSDPKNDKEISSWFDKM